MAERENTLRRWIREHRGIVVKVTRAYAWSHEDREDLSQEILLQVWRSMPSFRGNAAESTWIYRVALNTAMTWRRDAPLRKNEEQLQETAQCLRKLPDNAAEDQELVDWLYAEIAQWPKVDRSLVLLYLDGVSYRDMAEILGISESNVGVKLNRLKKRLAESGKGANDGH